MIDYTFFPENNLMFTVLCGEVSSQEFSDHIDHIAKQDHKGLKVCGLTIFCRNSEIKGLTSLTTLKSENAMRAANFRKGSKSAILAGNNLIYAFSRMYQLVANSQDIDETKVFREHELSDALTWLNIQELEQEIQSKVKQCESLSSPS